MVTKGALAEVLAVYSTAKTAGGADVPIAAVRDRIDTRFRDLSGQGFRTLGIAWRDVESASHVTRDQESAMVFAGLLVLWRARTHIGEDRATSGRRCTVVLGASCPDR